jgi:hypothetical protein
MPNLQLLLNPYRKIWSLVNIHEVTIASCYIVGLGFNTVLILKFLKLCRASFPELERLMIQGGMITDHTEKVAGALDLIARKIDDKNFMMEIPKIVAVDEDALMTG